MFNKLKALGGGAKEDERPRLKVCTSCQGKGTNSFYDTSQDKNWGGCDKCSQGRETPYGGLGVTLKCHCQENSTTYEFVRVPDLPHLKGFDKHDARALRHFQEELGPDNGHAVLLMCDDCNASYLIHDYGGRKKITSGNADMAKETNKAIASDLASRGVARVVRPSPRAPPEWAAEKERAHKEWMAGWRDVAAEERHSAGGRERHSAGAGRERHSHTRK
ncbi:hypothetical protein HYH03_013930 [Edaphochlamys debaryana]|uniref:Uncharacterized protein n=1 Tax=Edaphochlamys debaryana TaxID=47281 RepID=A0A836BSW1_9CHLO|nr:hypothetical protein HYH03_013930 [Edaphochlamys debaryana]|eukprot:KAG2487512.1 hypothetical protein HYH03_013930 [Edaphochlamys debaryana]